jgi:hypothetical protein
MTQAGFEPERQQASGRITTLLTASQPGFVFINVDKLLIT